MLRILVLLAIAAAFAPSLRAQPNEHDLIATLTALHETPEGQVLSDVRFAGRAGMKIVDTPMSRRSAVYILAILEAEQTHVREILHATHATRIELPRTPPQDPLHADDGMFEHLAPIRSNARILFFDATRCWMDGDFNGTLERTAGLLRLANTMLPSDHALTSFTGTAIRELAQITVNDMSEATTAGAQPRFSADALDEVRRLLELPGTWDPDHAARRSARAIYRDLAWMRSEFSGNDGPARYREYLAENGKTPSALRDAGAMLALSVRNTVLMRELISSKQTTAREAILKVWNGLTDAEKDELREEWDTMFADGYRFDDIPRLYIGEPAQLPTEAEIESQLDSIEALADALSDARTRQETRDAVALLRIEVERDRSQLTRIAAWGWGRTGPSIWQGSIERHDATLAELETLEEFVDR